MATEKPLCQEWHKVIPANEAHSVLCVVCQGGISLACSPGEERQDAPPSCQADCSSEETVNGWPVDGERLCRCTQ